MLFLCAHEPIASLLFTQCCRKSEEGIRRSILLELTCPFAVYDFSRNTQPLIRNKLRQVGLVKLIVYICKLRFLGLLHAMNRSGRCCSLSMSYCLLATDAYTHIPEAGLHLRRSVQSFGRSKSLTYVCGMDKYLYNLFDSAYRLQHRMLFQNFWAASAYALEDVHLTYRSQVRQPPYSRPRHSSVSTSSKCFLHVSSLDHHEVVSQ